MWNRIAWQLTRAKPISVGIEIESRDDESFKLAQQLAGLFSLNKTNKVSFNDDIDIVTSGVKITSKSEPDGFMEEALSMIFWEIGQRPNFSINPNVKPRNWDWGLGENTNIDLKVEVGGND